MEHTIDAKGKALGRIASQAATFLMGKNTANFSRDKISGNKVTVINTAHLNIEPRKLQNKTYKRYSGYPGGLKEEGMENLKNRKGIEEILKLAIYGMLPRNKHRDVLMQNIKIVK